jgi:hypothetical protein
MRIQNLFLYSEDTTQIYVVCEYISEDYVWIKDGWTDVFGGHFKKKSSITVGAKCGYF